MLNTRHLSTSESSKTQLPTQHKTQQKRKTRPDALHTTSLERERERERERMDNNMNMAEAEAVSVAELIQSLEQATFMAKQLASTTDPTHLLHIHSSLHQSHLLLSSFLSSSHYLHQSPPLPPPAPPASAAENSFSSATGAAEPMQVGDDEGGEAEENSRATIDRVEERMRNCFIKNKRPKRPLSPSSAAAAEEGRAGGADGFPGYDPHGTRLRALDLVYQFHG